MFDVLLIGAGGALGSVLRYLTVIFFERKLNKNSYYATFLVNMTGSFLLGATIGLLTKDSTLVLVFTTGFLGAFTTFSTFIYETLFSFASRKKAAIYVTASALIGFLLFWGGTKVAYVLKWQ